MDVNKRRLFRKSLIKLQFSYCPLIWMFHSRNMENKINGIHKRVLGLVYDDPRNLPSEELLVKDNKTCIHQKISKLCYRNL